jgi:hypothetical protein
MSRKKGEIVKLLLVILMVLGVVLGITLTLKPEPTLSPEALRNVLLPVSSDGGAALNSSSTPQNKAFNWLAVNNTSLRTYTNESIIQRYALATLYFSTNGDTWENKAHWMDDGNECDRWQDTSNDTKITCTDNGTLVELDLSSNGLQGTIPPEIGLLTSLGKFVIEERMTLYSTHMPNCAATFHHVIDFMHSCCFVNDSTEYLDLGFNILEGTMPTEIGQLKQLSEYTYDW